MLKTDLSIIDCGDNTFKLQLNNVEILNVDVQYSFDNSTWFDYSYQSPIGIGAPIGEDETITIYARAKDVNDDVYITKNETIKYYYMRPAPPSISSYSIKFESDAGVHVGEYHYFYTVYANCSLNGPDKKLNIKAEYYSSKENKWISFGVKTEYKPSDYSSSGNDGEARLQIEKNFKNEITKIRAYTVGDRDKYRYIYSISTSMDFSDGLPYGPEYTSLICDFNSNINFLKCDDNNLRFYIGSSRTQDNGYPGFCDSKIYYKIAYAATDSLVENYSYNYLPNKIELEANFTLVPYNNTNVYYTASLGAYSALYSGYDYYIQLDDEIYGPYNNTISIKGEYGLGNPYLKYKDEEDNGLPFFLYCDSGFVNMELYSLNNNSTLKIHKVMTGQPFIMEAEQIDYDQTLDYSYFINYLKKLNKKYIIFNLYASCPCGYYYDAERIVMITDKNYARAKKANGKYHPCAPYVVKDGNWTQCALNSAVLSKLKDDTGEYILDSNGENIYTLEDSSVISNS